MIGSEEKLELFKSSVLKDVKKETEKIISDAKKENADMIIGMSDRYFAAAEKEREDGKAAIRAEYAKKTQSCKAQSRKDILSHRQQLVDRIFASVTQRIREFTATKEYPEYLRRVVKDCKAKAGEIKLSEVDYENRDALLGDIASAYIISCDDSIFLGGLKLIPQGEKVVYDLSFDTALELQKERFSDSFDLKIVSDRGEHK